MKNFSIEMTKHWMKLIFRLVKGEAKISDLEDITTETTKNESEKKTLRKRNKHFLS